MSIQHLLQRGFVQDRTSFSENPYVQNQKEKSATASILRPELKVCLMETVSLLGYLNAYWV